MRESPIQNTIIRPLTEADFPKLLAFDSVATFERNDTPPDHNPPPFSIEELEQMQAKKEIMGGIFGNNGNMLAYWVFDVRDDELYLDGIAVHPDYRDQGVGTFILQLADQEARERGLNKCTLSVDPFNGRGVNAYLKHGYRITAYKKAYFGPEHPNTDRFFMEMELKDQKDLSGEKRELRVDNVKGMESALQEGFLGVSLTRASDRDNKHNLVIFQK